MQIIFRVDASLEIGSGHVMRCLTLADALITLGAKCHFVTREHMGNLVALIRKRGHGVEILPLATEPTNEEVTHDCDHNDVRQRAVHEKWLGVSWQKDAEQTCAVLKNFQVDWLVVDHYALDQQWETLMRPHCKKLMVIDDLADRIHQCDLLLDQTLGRNLQDYASLVPLTCKVLTGSQYALLRPEFAEWRPYSLQRRQQSHFKHLLITMGGVDQPNATGQVLQALKNCSLPQDCRITVVMGLHAPWLEKVRLRAKNMPWPTEVLVNISNIAQHMADSDLAIGAAGSSSWERCCLGLPTLMVILAENQKVAAAHIENSGAAHCITLNRQLRQQLQDWTQCILNRPDKLYQMASTANKITDGAGIERVMAVMQKIFHNSI